MGGLQEAHRAVRGVVRATGHTESDPPNMDGKTVLPCI